MDMLSGLLSRFTLRARVFHTGELCGISDFRADDEVGHLHLVRQGQVIVHHANCPSIHIDVPTFLFYPRAFSHRLVVPSDSVADILCAAIAFRDGDHNPLARALPDYLLIPLKQIPTLTHVLDLLFNEAFHDQSGRQLILDRLCDVLVVQVIRHAMETGQMTSGMLAGLATPGLARALVAMHEQPAEAWTLERLATLSGMSRSSFAKHFHQVVGITPADYLTSWRISMARSLLEKNVPVKRVAQDVGYGSQPAFTKAFTARLGMSPRAWLNRARSSA
jgi:AraC-like DNA-binding protein